MPYYDTIEEDLARAKEILERGRASDDPHLPPALRGWMEAHGSSGTIFGADVYAAYKLLESFVAEIESLRASLIPILRESEERTAALHRLTKEVERLRATR